MDPKDITPQNFEAGLHQLVQQFGTLHPFIITGILTGMQHNILSTMREQTMKMQREQQFKDQSQDPSSNGEQLSPGNKEFLDGLKEHIAEEQAHKEAAEITSNILHLPPRGITPVQQEPPQPPTA